MPLSWVSTLGNVGLVGDCEASLVRMDARRNLIMSQLELIEAILKSNLSGHLIISELRLWQD